MSRDRITQVVAALIMVLSVGASGRMLPAILHQSDQSVLRYTDVSVEGAPPFVAVGTMIGALRGLIVDWLWIKVHAMKEKGLFYEVMADADLITKLQPRFAAVWAFHGHNMAYNISVATHTQEERWEWVNAGIRLVRNEGLRYNPNDLPLHRELAFWFAHKIEGVADDAHLYYKRELCREWHMLLGEPPEDHEARIAWLKEIADAPETLAEAIRQMPSLRDLLDRLRAPIAEGQPQLDVRLNQGFLEQYTMWQAVTQQSVAARVLGKEKEWKSKYPSFVAYDIIARDPELQGAWKTLLTHARKRVLKDEYNMDPQLMYEYTRDLGPIDWRHGQAHALYWSRRGSQFGEGRIPTEDIYIVLNNDSAQLQAMQDLARWGRISFDPFSNELPGRFPDPRWIDVIDSLFDHYYLKHINVRGAGGERYINFLQNFMGSAICELYRSGETERAQGMLDRLANLFSRGYLANPKYLQPLDVFVRNETFDQYQAQPHVAPRDVWASLQYGFKVSMLPPPRPEVLRDSLAFADQVTRFFRENDWNDYVNKYGEGRIKDIIGELEDSAEIAYLQLITDPTVPLENRRTIWAGTDRVEADVTRRAPALRALVYDRVMPILAQQYQVHELSQAMSLDEAFPKPPGLEAARQLLAQRQAKREQEREELRARDPFTRK